MQEKAIKIKINEKVKELPAFLRAKDAEKILGISKWTLYRKGLKGELETVKVDGIRLFKTEDVLRLLGIGK